MSNLNRGYTRDPSSLLPLRPGVSVGGRDRIDIFSEGESAESRAAQLLQQLLDGEISVSDLMGPLYGRQGLTPAAANVPIGDQSPPSVAEEADFLPFDDPHNVLLRSHVHPPNYENPHPEEDDVYDLVVIGAGVAGLISVIIGAWLGKKCALVERHAMGGDCLNTGCVPSKALVACARAAHSVKSLAKFGVHIPEGQVNIDFSFVMERMREIRARISHHDSVQRYSREFCKHVFIGHARYLPNNDCNAYGLVEVKGDDGSLRLLKYRKSMIATGATPTVPVDIPGLKDVPHLTNLSFFNQTIQPKSLIVIGTGPVGMELAQSMARLGTRVICLERGSRLLPREDADASAVLLEQLIEDGLILYFNVCIESITFDRENNMYSVTILSNGERLIVTSDALLNATGRTPNVFGLDLENVGVQWDNRKGVHINEYFQTSNPNIYACGDCCCPYKFTHSADFQARIAIRNMFLGDHNRLSDLLIPWCTYTEPEIAHVGKYEEELRNEGVQFETFTRQLKDVDRCICDGVSRGFVKITVRAGSDEILGATICGPNAGDMISELTLCIQYGFGVTQIAGTIHPYPTTQESIRQACLGYNKYFKNPQGAPFIALKMLMKKAEDNLTEAE